MALHALSHQWRERSLGESNVRAARAGLGDVVHEWTEPTGYQLADHDGRCQCQGLELDARPSHCGTLSLSCCWQHHRSCYRLPEFFHTGSQHSLHPRRQCSVAHARHALHRHADLHFRHHHAPRHAFGSSLPTSATSTFVYTLVIPVSNVRVNAGGPAVGVFAADSGFSTSNIQGTGATVTTAGVTNAAPASLYDTERWNSGSLTYTSPVLTPGRTYTVRLHFAENNPGTSTPGTRIFNVKIEGATVLSNYDIVADVGYRTAVVKEFANVGVTDGNLNIEFLHVVENPRISAIEVIRN